MLRWREREIGLTPLEHDLIVCLTGTPGQVWTYARLHRAVWGNDHLGRRSDMHSVVRRLRRKLGRLDAPATIHAVRRRFPPPSNPRPPWFAADLALAAPRVGLLCALPGQHVQDRRGKGAARPCGSPGGPPRRC
ncbi:winged helix-turn-helix domain-containing protein [Micromonospora sp. BRA006-A]|nr:winged helix-turn-helix domain-containing protein [Micromonospora sp. BRA006-A]